MPRSIRASRWGEMSTVSALSTPRAKGPMRRSLDRFVSNRAAMAGLAIFVPILLAIITYDWWWPYGPNAIDLRSLNKGPSPEHWLGSDGVGRDVMARLLQGGRVSLIVAVVSVASSTLIGCLVASVARLSGTVVAAGRT